MKLSNNFKEEDIIRFWDFQNWCEVCRSNYMVSYHHIRSRISSSVRNSIPLCVDCHKKADSYNKTINPMSRKLLDLNQKRADRIGYQDNKDDKAFINML